MKLVAPLFAALTLAVAARAAPPLAVDVLGAETPVVGVERAFVFRWSDAPPLGRIGALARLKPRLAPMSFAEQAQALDFRAFHLTVYADPDVGRYAGDARPVALRQPGLKVLDPDRVDAEATCATYMTCLMMLDAQARSDAAGGPVVAVVEAGREPLGEGRAAHAWRRLFGDGRSAAPTWDELALETRTALPAGSPLVIVVAGGEGAAPEDAPFLVAGRDAFVFAGDGAPGDVAAAARRGALTVVVGASEHAEDRIGALDAAALGAQVVIVDVATARSPVLLELAGVD